MWDCYSLKCKLIFGLCYKETFSETEHPTSIVIKLGFTPF